MNSTLDNTAKPEACFGYPEQYVDISIHNRYQPAGDGDRITAISLMLF